MGGAPFENTHRLSYPVDLYRSLRSGNLSNAYACGQVRAEPVFGLRIPGICSCNMGDHMGVALDTKFNQEAFRVVFNKSLTSNFNSGTKA